MCPPSPSPCQFFYLSTDFDKVFFSLLLIMSSFQNMFFFYDHYDIKYIFFFTSDALKNHIFCSNFAQHSFGQKLTPEILVIEIIYQHVWGKSIVKKTKHVIYDIIKVRKKITNKHNAEQQRKPQPANQSNILYTRCIISFGIIILDIQ